MDNNTLDKFEEYCLTTCSPQRIEKVKSVLTIAEKAIGKDLTKLKVDDVVKFLSFVNQSAYSPWTKNDLKKIVKRFIKWHYKDLNMIEGDKVKLGFKTISSKHCMVNAKRAIVKNNLITPKELEKLMRAAKSLKWKAIVSFLYESAFRPCEVRALKWKDLNFEDGLGICRVSIISPKTGESRTIPIKDSVLHLKRWREEYQFPDLKDSDFVFPSQHERDKPMATGVISQMFLRLSKDAKTRPIRPYLLRHSRITELQARLPEKIAAKFAGHGIVTSELYNHLSSEDVENTMIKEVYAVEDISPEKKNILEKEIENLKKLRQEDKELFYSFINDLKKDLEPIIKKNNLNTWKQFPDA